jgi:hypothetical protein
MNITPYIILWSLLALVVLGLALYRKLITMHHEDDFVHLAAGEQQLIPQQIALSAKLDKVDRWGKTLTVATLIAGLAIASAYVWSAWVSSQQLH